MVIAEELKARGWLKTELSRRRKSDPEKLALGARLRRETTLTIKEIAKLLVLGTYNTANARLHAFMNKKKKGHSMRRRRRTRKR